MLLDASITKNTLSKSIKEENVDMDFQTDKKMVQLDRARASEYFIKTDNNNGYIGIGVILTLSCTKMQ